MIIIKENIEFVSRNEAKEILAETEFVNDFIYGFSSIFEDPEILNNKIITLATYPALEFTVKGSKENLGYNFEMIIKNWVVFYEDKIVFLQGTSLNSKEFYALESLYTLITNSVIFPDQYKD